MIAVIKTGGKQYTVKPKDKVQIEKIAGNVGDTVTFDYVLMTSEETGDKLKLGDPMLKGATVTATITKQFRTSKIRVVKYKAKSHYRRTIGHRQRQTEVEIVGIK